VRYEKKRVAGLQAQTQVAAPVPEKGGAVSAARFLSLGLQMDCKPASAAYTVCRDIPGSKKEGTFVELSPDQLAVLEAMTQPDPSPPIERDSAAAAIQRRLSPLSRYGAAVILAELNALGLTNVPVSGWQVGPTPMMDLRRFITRRGWEVLQAAGRGQDL
jgi:hypothetical protein